MLVIKFYGILWLILFLSLFICNFDKDALDDLLGYTVWMVGLSLIGSVVCEVLIFAITFMVRLALS